MAVEAWRRHKRSPSRPQLATHRCDPCRWPMLPTPPVPPNMPSPPTPAATQVEDMLRRSFAEFHVQRRQPELTAVLEEGQEALRKLRARSWPRSPLGTTREAVEAYYDVCAEVARLDSLVQGEVAQSRAAAAALAHGRLALVTHPGSGLVGLGVVVEGGAGGGRAAPGPRPAGGGAEAEGPARTMLMLYSPGPRDEYAGAGEAQRDAAEPAPAAQPAPPPGLKLMGKKKVGVVVGLGGCVLCLCMGGGK